MNVKESQKFSLIEVPGKGVFDNGLSYDCQYLTFLIIRNGDFECTINNSHYFISVGSCLMMPQMSTITGIRMSTGFQGYLLSLSKGFIEQVKAITNCNVIWVSNQKLRVHRITPDEFSSIERYIQLLQCNIHDSGGSSSEPTRFVQMALACMISRLFMNDYDEITCPDSTFRQKTISEQFVNLVQANYLEHRTLNFYADKMCITPKYLSSIVSKSTGKTAFCWIDECVTTHAMRLLKTTGMTISQISDELNFRAVTDFCRCFRRSTGMTPTQFRESC